MEKELEKIGKKWRAVQCLHESRYQAEMKKAK